jgi:hypothetical protein
MEASMKRSLVVVEAEKEVRPLSFTDRGKFVLIDK